MNTGDNSGKTNISGPEFRGINPEHGTTDGREPWEWESHYPSEAWVKIRREAWIVATFLVCFLATSAFCAGLSGTVFNIPIAETVTFDININLIGVFFFGGLGGTTFSIKWLMHSVATGKWHSDRIYWRIFVPLIGGIYAVVVLDLFASGFVGPAKQSAPVVTSIQIGLSFLVGYFSDGVSGLLTNVANAIFGTVEKK